MGRLFHCGEHLRGSESGNLERFTVSLTSISLFLGVCFVFGVVVCVLFVGFWCCFVFLVLFPPTMLRSSSCPPELTTVRAVMVRAAMEKKKSPTGPVKGITLRRIALCAVTVTAAFSSSVREECERDSCVHSSKSPTRVPLN